AGPSAPPPAGVEPVALRLALGLSTCAVVPARVRLERARDGRVDSSGSVVLVAVRPAATRRVRAAHHPVDVDLHARAGISIFGSGGIVRVHLLAQPPGRTDEPDLLVDTFPAADLHPASYPTIPP